MTVPGSNLLNRAFGLIAQQSFDYYAYVSRSVNAVGYQNAVYADAQALKGSVQPVPRRLYEYMGLDLQKNYYNIYVSKSAVDVRRDVSGDYVIYNDARFNCESLTAWYAADGWVQILAVEVPNA